MVQNIETNELIIQAAAIQAAGQVAAITFGKGGTTAAKVAIIARELLAELAKGNRPKE